MGPSTVSSRSPREETRLSSADDTGWRCGRTTQAQKGRIDCAQTAAGSRLRRRVHRRGSSAGDALSLRKRRWILRGVSRATRRERIRSERKAEGNEGSGGRFVPAASLHRDSADLSMEGGVRRGKRLCAITEAACTDSQSGELLGTKNPHPPATKLRDTEDEMNKAILGIRDLNNQLQALEKRL